MHKRFGFTLVEIMIVIAILGILSAIAIPSYQEYIRKSRRTDAKEALLSAAALQERYFLQNNHYSSDISTVGGKLSKDKFYSLELSCSSTENNVCKEFSITASPSAGSSQLLDKMCLRFEVDNYQRKVSYDSISGGNETKFCW